MRPLRRSSIAVLAAAALTVASGWLQAAELPALHPAPNKAVEPSAGGNEKGFEIPGSGVSVTYGGYIEGAATMSNLKSAPVSGPMVRRRKPTP